MTHNEAADGPRSREELVFALALRAVVAETTIVPASFFRCDEERKIAAGLLQHEVAFQAFKLEPDPDRENASAERAGELVRHLQTAPPDAFRQQSGGHAPAPVRRPELRGRAPRSSRSRRQPSRARAPTGEDSEPPPPQAEPDPSRTAAASQRLIAHLRRRENLRTRARWAS